jgi:N-acetylglutamate synthase
MTIPTDVARIRRLEEIALNCWPALRTEFYDGWVLRFADGYSRRSNSVNPLYSSTEDFFAKLRFCERRYRDAGLRVVFKLTSSPDQRELDSALAAEGYAQEAPTSEQTLPLDGWRAEEPADAAHWDEPAEEWLAAQFALNNTSPRQIPIARKILGMVEPPRRFTLLREGGKPAACGLGILRRGTVSVYDIVVENGVRRRGYGRRLMASLLNWGKAQGAGTAALQVMENNPPALALYASLGFREEYRYWYRSSN